MNNNSWHPVHPSRAGLSASLATLESAELVRRLADSERAYIFKHVLIQDSAYAYLLRQDRKLLHRLVAEALERTFADTSDSPTGDLAHHYYLAEAWEKALAYLDLAAEAAQHINAPHEAIVHWTHALEAARQLPGESLARLYRRRGQAHEILGNFEEGQADYQAALDAAASAHDAREEWGALLDLGFLWVSRDYARSEDYFERALALARTIHEPALLAYSLNRVGNLYLNYERPWDALAYHREALEIFQAQNEKQGIAESLDLVAISYMELADCVQAERHYRRAITLFRQLGDRRGESNSLAIFAERAWTRWTDVAVLPPFRFTDALLESEQALQLARAISWRAGEAFALLSQSTVHYSQGEYGLALEQIHGAIQLAKEIQHQQWLAYGHGVLGWIYLDLLAFEEAQREIEFSLQLAEPIQSPLMSNFIIGGLADVYMTQGMHREVELLLDSMFRTNPAARRIVEPENKWSEVPLTISQRTCLAVYAELALVRDDVGLAAQIVERLIFSTPNLTADAIVPRLWHLNAKILMSRRQFDESEQLLQAVHQFAQTHGAMPLLRRTHTALGELYQAEMRPSAAVAEFAAARAIVQELAATIPEPALRAKFLERTGRLVAART